MINSFLLGIKSVCLVFTYCYIKKKINDLVYYHMLIIFNQKARHAAPANIITAQ